MFRHDDLPRIPLSLRDVPSLLSFFPRELTIFSLILRRSCLLVAAPRLVREGAFGVLDEALTASHGAGNRPPFALPRTSLNTSL